MNISATDAITLYKRLRCNGQTGILARLSVESKLGHLSVQERQRIHALLAGAETKKSK